MDPNTTNDQPSESQNYPPQPIDRPSRLFPVKTIVSIVAGIVLVAGGVFLFWNLKKAGQEIPLASPLPKVSGVETNLETPAPTPQVTASPAPTAQPVKADKTKLAVKVLNGTGVTGEAAYLKNILVALGYKDITAGNAETQNATTTSVAFSSTVDQATKDELLAKLTSVYESVDETGTVPASVDVLVVTGAREGVSPTTTP